MVLGTFKNSENMMSRWRQLGCQWRQMMSTLSVDPPTNINVHEHKLSRPTRIPKPKVIFKQLISFLNRGAIK